jgi:hypothetical protein
VSLGFADIKRNQEVSHQIFNRADVMKKKMSHTENAPVE